MGVTKSRKKIDALDDVSRKQVLFSMIYHTKHQFIMANSSDVKK